jgi:hypothetical protein
MDGSPVSSDPLTLSATLMAEEPAYMARWLALEVLIADQAVCADTVLYDRLSVLQEKWQQETLARRGVIPPS